MTLLCDLGWKYKTDKCPQIKHHFTEFYDEMFRNKRDEVKKVVEIGIGNMSPYFVKGASLYMWQEYFPNAMIYGADINRDLLIKDTRIESLFCDQTKKTDLNNLIKTVGSDIDLFIDDGLHDPDSQVFTCLTVMPLVSNKTIYVIEDAGQHSKVINRLGGYDTRVLRRSKIKYNDDRMIIVRHGLF